jgi:uncharacterized membrane protein YqjE
MSIKSSIADYLRLDELKENFLKLIEAKFELKKLEVQEKLSTLLADLLVKLVIGFFILLAFIFINIIIAIMLNNWLKSSWIGFGVLILIYLIGAGVVALNSEKIKNKVRKKVDDEMIKANI